METADVEEVLQKLIWFHGTPFVAEDASVEDIQFEDDGFGPEAEDGLQEEEKGKNEFSAPEVRRCMRLSLPPDLLGKFSVSIGSKSGRRCLHLLLCPDFVAATGVVATQCSSQLAVAL